MSTATEVKERPILFSATMVRAILDGRKTQTRRVVKPQPSFHEDLGCIAHWIGGAKYRSGLPTQSRCPYGVPGDRLWVRETFWEDCAFHMCEGPIRYCATDDDPTPLNDDGLGMTDWQKRPSIHMPRRGSRITLEITDVRVQRLQEISEADAAAEGVQPLPPSPPTRGHQRAFKKLWNEINEKRGFGWDANPWVWAITFRRVET